MPSNVNKCQILQVVTRNQKSEYEMNGTKLESVQSVRDLAMVLQLRQASNSPSNAKTPQGKLKEWWVL